MRILVTGGAGYVGSVVVEHLIDAGETVAVLDNLSFGHPEAVHSDALFVEGDLADVATIDRVLAEFRPDAVMHLAGNTLVGLSMEQPFDYLGANVTNGMNLFHSMVRHGVRQLIFSSTANLFENPQRIPIDEQERVSAASPYGESKHILERMLHWLQRIGKLQCTTLRYFNAAGATERLGEDHTPEFHLIPIVLQVALGQRENVTIFGDDYPTRDGTCVRDFVHVTDLARAHLAALRTIDRGNRTYNIGIERGYSILEVIETARAVTGHKIPMVIGPRRPGDPAELVADCRKIREQLGWRPQFTTLRDIIDTAWQWHRAHPDGYRTDLEKI